MQDLNKIYYLDRNPESKRNIPFDKEFYILHIKGCGFSVSQVIGFYEHGQWFIQGTLEIAHPYGYSELIKWSPETGPQTQGKDIK